MPPRAGSVARLWNRTISQTFVHNCSQPRELLSQHVPRLFRAHQQNSQIFHAALFLKFANDRFRDEFVRLKIDMQVKIFDSWRCRRADGGDPRPADLAPVVIKLEEDFEKRLDAVRARENDPVVTVRVLNQLREGAQIAWWLDPNRWQFKYVGAERAQLRAQFARLLSRARNDDPFSGKRPLLVPIQALPQGDAFAKHRHRRSFEANICHALRYVLKCSSQRFLPASRRPTHERDRQILAHALLKHFSRNRFKTLHAHQHHLRAAQFSQPRVINRASSFLWILVAGEKSDVRIFR